ncbi:MAG: TlyA family rRNA (cytidine-2'-O)-methyltransferase [Streptosporangiales bacterium]|nr:TlyA family rRNA (cytidine-2'-O)-methyltransferase [Streptosporangiales bacterium]
MTDARLDVVLVRRGLARSRREAHDLVGAGRVAVAGRTATKPGRPVADDAAIEVDRPAAEYVARSGRKLAGALTAFGQDGLHVEGRRALDAGASTGGFTDVLLRAGAAEVHAVDVGYGQLAASIRAHPAVRVHERTNVRELTPDALGGRVALVVADLSFISLTLVLPALARCATPDADHALLVKPQFEVGRQAVGGGVVRSPQLRADAVTAVAAAARECGLGVRGLVESDVQGAHGNVEYLLWLRAGAGLDIEAAVRETVLGGG